MAERRVRYCPGSTPGRKCWLPEGEAQAVLRRGLVYIEVSAKYGQPDLQPPHLGDCSGWCPRREESRRS